MKVKKFMTANPVVVEQNQSIREAKRLLDEHGFRHLPITDNGRVVGILSDRDIVRSVAITESVKTICGIEGDNDVLIQDIMGEHLLCLTPDDNVKDAARIMSQRKIGSLPVVDNGKLVGIITETDILKAFTEMLDYIGQ